MRRVKGILLKSLQECNQIATHNLILSQVDSTDSCSSSKILLFRFNQMAQNVAAVATFQRAFLSCRGRNFALKRANLYLI